MRRGNGDLAADLSEVGLDAFGEALAVIVVRVGQRGLLDPFVLQNRGQHLALARIGRCGTEEQAVIRQRRQRGRCRGGRDHYDTLGHRHVLQHGGRHARTIAADDRADLVRGDETLRRCRGRGRIDARGVAADRDDFAAA